MTKRLFLCTLLLCLGSFLFLSAGNAKAAGNDGLFSGENAEKAVCVQSNGAVSYYDTVMDAFAALNNSSSDAECYIRGGEDPVVYTESFDTALTVSGRSITIAAYGGEAILRASGITGSLFSVTNGSLTLGTDTGTGILHIDFNHLKANSAISLGGSSAAGLTLKQGIALENARIEDGPSYVFNNDIACLIYVWEDNKTYNGVVSMEGGSITGCQVDEYAHLIYLRKGAKLQMSGGSITGNQLGRTSSAVYAKDGTYAAMVISGGTISNDAGYALKDTVTDYTGITLSGTPVLQRIWHVGGQPIQAEGYSGDRIVITPADVTVGGTYVKGCSDTALFTLDSPEYILKAISNNKLRIIKNPDISGNAELISYYIDPDFIPQATEVRTFHENTGISFVHPGILKNRAILDQAKNHIRSGDEPWVNSFFTWISGINLIPRVSEHARATEPFTIGSRTTSDKPTLLQPLEDDAEEALQQTELWYVTGKQEYLDNALQIIRGWYHLQGVGNVFDEQIQASRGVYSLCQAAEILRYSNSGWTSEDTDNFLHFLDVLEGKYNRITHFMNQDGECIRATMAASIFRNDMETYQNCVERMTVSPELHAQCVAQGYTKEGELCDPAKPCLHSRSGAILFQFREVTKNASTGAAVGPNIQLVEMGRDQAHPGADIYNPVHVGIMAYIQGTMVDPETGYVTNSIVKGKSIFEYLDNRVLKGADYYCRYNSEETEAVNGIIYYPVYAGTDEIYKTLSATKQGKSTGWHDYIVGLLYHYYQSFYPQLNRDAENPMGTEGVYVKKAYEYAEGQGEGGVFFNIPEEEDLVLMKEPDVQGDYNGDGKVTAVDALLLLKQEYYNESPTATQKMLYDINHDEALNISDVQKLLKKAAE